MPKIDAIVMLDGTELEFEGNVFVAEYGVTSYDDIFSAYNAGKALLCIRGDMLYTLREMEGPFYFISPNTSLVYWARVETISGVTTWSNGYTNINAYPWGSAVSPLSSDYLTVATASGLIRRSNINFGSSTTKYLANNGTWQNIPTNVSSFNNDSGYLTLATLPIYNGGVS